MLGNIQAEIGAVDEGLFRLRHPDHDPPPNGSSAAGGSHTFRSAA